MPFKQIVTDATATDDTNKKLIDTIDIPKGTSKLVGLAAQFGGAGITTLETVSGKIELESDDVAITPAQFLTGSLMVLTSGVGYMDPKQWPCDIDTAAGGKIKVYCTMDLTQTINPTCRVQLTFA